MENVTSPQLSATSCQQSTKFSVIIPIYNTAEYLHRCIDSIINQDYENLEVILVDDGSTDSSPTICDDYAKRDNRIKVIHKQNEGLSPARNDGILEATGEYLVFVDSDDYLSQRSFITFHNTIEKNINLDVFTSNYQIIRPKYSQYVRCYIPENNIPVSGQDFLKTQKKHKRFKISACQYITRRLFILQNNLFFEKGILQEDILWCHQIILNAKKALALDFVHYHNVVRQGSITQSKNLDIHRGKSLIFIANKLEQEYKKIDDIELLYLLNDNLIGTFMQAFMILRGSEEWSNFKHLFNHKFIENRAKTAKNRWRVFLYTINPSVYFYTTKCTRFFGRKINTFFKYIKYQISSKK